MDATDKAGFKELFDGLADYYRQEHLGNMAIRIYFGALQRYSLEQITEAASQHVADVKAGRFFPKAADFISQLEGGEITADALLAAAVVRQTPLGCLVRIAIGHWDIDCQDSFYLRQRATECLQRLPEWRSRAASGDYTDHEISVMLTHGVDPAAPVIQGIAPPAPALALRLRERAAAIALTPEHQKRIAAPYQPGPDDKTASLHPVVNGHVAALLEKMRVPE